jgi:tetratricopeptide (TPR) repeat protein
MKLNQITNLLNNPSAVDEIQTMNLESILTQYPYLQGLRAVYLKGLHDLKSYRYNHELKKTAAYTTDRSLLFDFITSENFKTINYELIEHQQKTINEIIVEGFEVIIPNEEYNNLKIEEFKKSNETSTEILTPIEEKLEISKPLLFDVSETHSFSEWLQLTKFEPIKRDENENLEENLEEKNKKIDLIDKFIESNPKIGPIKSNLANINVLGNSLQEPTHLMTETLARIYLEQKKYKKAIQAYEILILKYPEKSIFFANRIKDIKELQQNN